MKTKISENCLDIINLIEKNPITRLNKKYQNKFIQKIKHKFSETQQQLFVASFYCLLNYNSKTDFIIEFNSVWKWLGFSRKDHCKVVLDKHFTTDIDYIVKKNFTNKISEKIKAPEVAGANQSLINLSEEIKAPATSGALKIRGCAGLNKEIILLNINTFKKLCLKSNTTKADEIHDYYIKLEEVFQEILNEESEELKLQLEQQKISSIKDTEDLLIKTFHLKCVVYLIQITSTLFKFGKTDDIKKHMSRHKNEIDDNVILVFCIESKNNTLLENKFKEYISTTNYRKSKIFKNKNQTELIEINNLNSIKNKLVKLNENVNYDKESILIEKLQIKEQSKSEEIKLKELELQIKLAELEIKKLDTQLSNKVEITENKKLKTQLSNKVETEKVEELKIKLISLEERKAKQLETSKKYMAKYRQSDKYKQRVSSDEYKQNRNRKYKEKGVTEEQKKKKKEYYNKTKTNKSDLIKTDIEKNKFYEWLKLNVKYDGDDSIVIWWKLLEKYLNYKTSDLISKIYKEYFIEYISLFYPNITTKYIKNGYKYFVLQSN
jgi:hypothetical protein